MSKAETIDLNLSELPRAFTSEADKMVGRATFEGQEPLLGAVRLYSGIRRPANDEIFVRLAYLSSRLTKVVNYLADKYRIDAEDLRQHIYFALWNGLANRVLRPAEEKELFQYVYSVGRHHALRMTMGKDALTQAHSLDEMPSDQNWLESLRFSDEGESAADIERLLTEEKQAVEFSPFVTAARAIMESRSRAPRATRRRAGVQKELDLSVLSDGSKVKKPRSINPASIKGRSQGRATIAAVVEPIKGSTRETARQIKIQKPKPNALLDRVGRALLGEDYLSEKVPTPAVKTVRAKRGRPAGPSNVEERRTQEQAELYTMYRESCIRAADYARAIGTSNYMLNKYFSAAVQVPDDLLERAREYHIEIKALIAELSIRYRPPMSQIMERWSNELAGRPLLNEEFSDILGVTTSTIRRWRKNEAKPSIMKLSALELVLRKHFGLAH
ncbi:helix-turn-helix transcriptional regulator [Hydrogenophaga aromaticivorans]|jgi:post-segregation antitoxin (ccd killing protein)|uniref:helix-turn-helix transcriptional regulator n=1 Tax=Hydrogenophaga aromaticivorans TaxID=2610898 RepID=UPI001B36CE12|nr:helix-turn-helix transcriptional regulator [Hydrogenophaga aromaticivorans]MBQ0918398.1 helix-turn-helix transcriptional regulator [Hydrogenophaga aromaticivorans]